MDRPFSLLSGERKVIRRCCACNFPTTTSGGTCRACFQRSKEGFYLIQHEDFTEPDLLLQHGKGFRVIIQFPSRAFLSLFPTTFSVAEKVLLRRNLQLQKYIKKPLSDWIRNPIFSSLTLIPISHPAAQYHLRLSEMPPFPVSELLVMSWSAGDPRDSSLFTSWGVLYRFETSVERRKTITTVWRAISETKQERVARFEWNADGDLGRALIGRSSIPMADLVRRSGPATSMWTGPDGFEYTWAPSTTTTGEILLYDPNGAVIALYRKVPPRRWDIGEVVTTDGELHFFSNAGSRTVTHPPMMDLVVLSIMLNRMVIR